jgi:hypothetical protein
MYLHVIVASLWVYLTSHAERFTFPVWRCGRGVWILVAVRLTGLTTVFGLR